MSPRIIPAAPDDSELQRWADNGVRRAPTGSNIVTFVSPDEAYALTVEVDDPVHGYLLLLQELDEDERIIGKTVVDDEELALDVAANMAAAADDLAALEDRPRVGPETVHREDVQEGQVGVPDEWDDEDEWQDALDDAFEEADIRRSKGTLTTKTIDGRDYYYLQWREGDTVKSQYVAPVNPAN